MKIEDYISQKKQLGFRLHESNCFWWQQISPYYCKPAYEFMVFETLEWLPRWSESIVGYKCFVSNQEIATSNSDHMFLNWNSGEQFDISCLPSKKRNQVRKGMKLCEIRPLRCLEKYWKDLQRINISNSQRTKSGRSPQYYVKNYVDWKNDIQRLHALENRQWLGAFVNGTLAAYFYGYAVGTTYHINAAKSDTEFLRSNPNDALLFTLLDHALNTEECTQIEYGGYTPTDPSLSKFKEQYGFSKKTFWTHQNVRQPFDVMMRLTRSFRRRQKVAPVHG